MKLPKRIFYKKEYEQKAIFLLFFLGGAIVIQFLIIGYLATSSIQFRNDAMIYSTGCIGDEDPK